MTIGERVKKIRTDNNLTLEKFGSRLGVSKVAISKIEHNENALSEQMCRSICREFSVNEQWLRTGEGKMMEARPIADELKEKIDMYLPDEDEEFRLRLTRMILNIKPEDMKKLELYAEKYLFPQSDDDAEDEDEGGTNTYLPFA